MSGKYLHDASVIKKTTLALTDKIPVSDPDSGPLLYTTPEDVLNLNNPAATELTGTAWYGSNVWKALTANTALTLSTTKVRGILDIVSNSSYTLSINGTSITINNTGRTTIAYQKVNGTLLYYTDTPVVDAGTDVTAPTFTFEAIDANTLRGAASESMGTVTIAGFSFKQNGATITPDSVSGATTQWDFVVSETLLNTDTLLWSYNATTGATIDLAGNEVATITDQAVTNSIAGAEFIVWNQLTNMADAGSGTLDNTNSSSGGGTATKRLVKANGNYVQEVIPDTTIENELFVFFLSQYNDGVNVWSGTDVLVGIYLLTTMFTRVGTSGGGITADTGITPAAAEIWRFEVSGDDILINRSTNGGSSFTTVATKTGVLTGITNIYVRGILVTGDAGQRVIQNAKGKGLVTI